MSELNNKIEKLEVRFIEGELPKELFKFKADKAALEQKLAFQNIDSSNLEKIIDKGMSIAENISKMWLSGGFEEKQKLQSLIFPEGILYDKQKDAVRTVRLNSLFAAIPQLTSILGGNKKSYPVKNGSKSPLVVLSSQSSNFLILDLLNIINS